MIRYCVIALVMHLALPARADVQEFLDKSWWEQTAGDFNSITFLGYYPPWQLITNQFEKLGVLFSGSGSNHYTIGPGSSLDGVRLFATNGGPFPENAPISLVFSQPQFSIAVDYPGRIQIELYNGSKPIYTSSLVHPPGQSWSAFFGLVSDEAFDRALVRDPWSGSEIDNLFFGSATPARGACCLVDDTCQNDMLEFSCLAQRGIYQGDGSTCETICPPSCQGDIDGDGSVDIDDLLVIINHWGSCPYPCPLPCPGDIIPNCWVNIDDLLMIVNSWGQCR